MAIGSDWRRVADYVRDRRIELDLTQADVHAAGGPSPATQRLIEGALQTSYQSAILARLERALQWERGSIRAIAGGGEPVPAGSPARVIPGPAARVPFDLSVLSPAEQRELAGAAKVLADLIARIEGTRKEEPPEDERSSA